MLNPDRAIEEAARAAAPDHPDSIRALAHSVLTYPHVYSLPPEVSALLEADLTRSEIAYRNKLGRGVKEEQLLNLINELARKFRMPDYVRTTPAQLRNLRMRLAINSPYFMGAGLTSHSLNKGQLVNETMSPLQAMHLLNVMIDQKVLNDLYQDPSIDIVHVEKQRNEAYKKEAAAKGKAFIVVGRSNPHGLEIRNAISKGIQSMSISDAYDFVNQAFTAMGLR